MSTVLDVHIGGEGVRGELAGARGGFIVAQPFRLSAHGWEEAGTSSSDLCACIFNRPSVGWGSALIRIQRGALNTPVYS